jgi:anti-sigma factor RsiW
MRVPNAEEETTPACFDEATAASYVAGALSGSEIERVELHIDVCSACRRLVSELARMRTDG